MDEIWARLDQGERKYAADKCGQTGWSLQGALKRKFLIYIKDTGTI